MDAKSPIEDATVEITVIRADGTLQDYGVVSSLKESRLDRARAARRTYRLNAEARRANPQVPRTKILPMIRHILGDN